MKKGKAKEVSREDLERMLRNAAEALRAVEYPKYLCDAPELIEQCDEVLEWADLQED